VRRESISFDALKRSTEGTDAILIFQGFNDAGLEGIDISREIGNA
jgi:hypothetical protein